MMTAKKKTTRKKEATKKATKESRVGRGGATPRQNLWLFHFLNQDNPVTFLNRTQAAMAAYNGKSYQGAANIGHINFKKFKPDIEAWLEEEGYSLTSLKMRLVKLMEAKETKLQTVRGRVDETGLPENTRVIVSGETERISKSGEAITETETLLAVEVDAVETRRRSIDMGLKMRPDGYASEKHDHNVKGNIRFIMELPQEGQEEGDGDSGDS